MQWEDYRVSWTTSTEGLQEQQYQHFMNTAESIRTPQSCSNSQAIPFPVLNRSHSNRTCVQEQWHGRPPPLSPCQKNYDSISCQKPSLERAKTGRARGHLLHNRLSIAYTGQARRQICAVAGPRMAGHFTTQHNLPWTKGSTYRTFKLGDCITKKHAYRHHSLSFDRARNRLYLQSLERIARHGCDSMCSGME